MKKVVALFVCLMLVITAIPFSVNAAQGILGDVDADSKVKVKDATLVQKFVANIVSFSDSQYAAADVNVDGKVNVRDATAIQKFVANISTGLNIGKPIGSTTSGVKDSISVCLGSYPNTLDPSFVSFMEDASYALHVFSGLAAYEQAVDGSLKIVADCAKALPDPVSLGGGKVSYTYELREDLKWSDGTKLTASDFVWSWNRAVAEWADYSYLFEVIDGYEDAANGVGKLNVASSNGGSSLTVVLKNDVPYFHELLTLPIFMPLRRDVVENNYEWSDRPSTYIGNGPYKVTSFTSEKLVMEKNEYYHNKGEVKTKTINFSFDDYYDSMYNDYIDGTYQFLDAIDPYQENDIRTNYPDEYSEFGVMGTYYISFNMNDTAFNGFTQEERASIRKALGLLIDRNYICDNIIVGGSVPANTFVSMGINDADGVEAFIDNANAGKGYYSIEPGDYAKNKDEAISILKSVAKSSGKFTVSSNGKVSGFPTLSYIYNTNVDHKAIADYIKSAFSSVGINMTVNSMEWGIFLEARWEGNYSIARNGWVSDYNDPISFLELWVSDSYSNDSQFGYGLHANYKGYSYNGKNNLTWAQAYDTLIYDIKMCKDVDKRYELMHQAEDMLMSTGAICPIYYYTDTYLCKESLEGSFANPLGYKYFMYSYIPE